MASRFSIEAVFSAVDKMTRPLRNMAQANNRYTNQIRKDYRMATRSADKFTSSLNNRVNTAMKRTAQTGGVALAAGLGLAAREYVSFDDAIMGSAARFKDINVTTAEGQKQLELLRERARLAGSTTEFTATQAAEALDFLARAGFSSAEAMGSLDTMINLATASGEDFASVADWSSDLLGSFGMASDDAATKIANLTRLNDVLVKTANSANVTVGDMFETMKTAGPIATTLGYDLEQVAALTAVLGNSGIKGTEGATALKNAMLNIANMTPKAQKALSQLNLTQADLVDKNGDMLKFTDILKLMAPKLKAMGTQKRAAILDMIFGKRAIAGAKNLIDNIENIDKFEESLRNAAGTAKQTAEFMRQSLGNKIKSIISALTEKSFQLFEAFDKDGRDGLTNFYKAILEFDMKPIINAFRTFGTILYWTYKILGPFLPLIISLVATWKAYKMILTTAAIAQQVINALMLANPIGLVIAAVAALGYAIYDLYSNWDLYSASFNAKILTWEAGFYRIKVAVYDLLNTMGLLSNEMLYQAKVDFLTKGTEAARARIKFLDIKKEKEGGGRSVAPITQRDIMQTITERKETTSSIDIRNKSSNDVDVNSIPVKQGGVRRLQPSGT